MLALTAYGTQFFVTASMAVVFAQLDDLKTQFGLSDTSIGVIASTSFVAAFVALIALSPLIDRGHGAKVATFAIAACVLGNLGFIVAETTLWLATSRGLLGIGMGMFAVVARKALIGEDLAGGMAKVGVLLSCAVAGFIAGPPIGSQFGKISLDAPFVAMVICVALTGVPAALLISRAKIATSSTDWSRTVALLANGRVRAATLGEVALWAFIGLFDSTIDIYTASVGLSPDEFSIGLLLLGIPLLVLPARAGALAERVGATRVFAPAFVLLVPAIALYGFIGGLVTFIVIGLVEAVVESFAAMGAQAVVLEITGAEEAAVGTGLLEATGLLAAAVTAYLGPISFGRFGAEVTFGGFGAIAAVLIAWAMVELWAERKTPRNQPPRRATTHGSEPRRPAQPASR